MEFLIDFFSGYGYWAVFFVLLACGFGLPIPEDVTLVSGGVISGLGYTNVHWMLVVSMVGVLVGDSTMYWLGRIYGKKILRFRFIKPLIRRGRLSAVRKMFDKYGNRLLFTARFLPGLRAVVYLVSGITNRVNYLQFVFVDFCAAIISVPIWVYLGNFGASNLDWVEAQMHKGQAVVYVILVAVILFVAWKIYKRRKKKSAKIKHSTESCDKVK
ncbi:DedA family protein [Phocoenobacter skyensis]|uniref:DedA family protein n=1 Tax=Phocoenobacter skyensis TaxID=97481 RepID=A0A1H7Z532_9PAST|nr:DedA family protein [Pasteurella skyensis]MDP8080153.1 DedA family protein [Pasteurella skyensis]MDP8086155.1 DedA family protein [Pasteurella skyensis]MDP8185871.1 DedA family protein [Pasteurella skyensis]QLB22937.1 alpha-amylase [Pasteurella skyensis]SEM53094.1 membrane protein DedA, SNARE-associated domain [Pasteurella skyensis]